MVVQQEDELRVEAGDTKSCVHNFKVLCHVTKLLLYLSNNDDGDDEEERRVRDIMKRYNTLLRICNRSITSTKGIFNTKIHKGFCLLLYESQTHSSVTFTTTHTVTRHSYTPSQRAFLLLSKFLKPLVAGVADVVGVAGVDGSRGHTRTQLMCVLFDILLHVSYRTTFDRQTTFNHCFTC